MQRESERGPIDHVERAAVGDHCDPAPRVPRAEREDRGDHPCVEAAHVLAAGQRVVRIVAAPALPLERMPLEDLVQRETLEHAESLLAQRRHRIGFQAEPLRRGRGGLPGALQVAAGERVDRLAGEALGEALRLRQAARVQGDVDLPLESVLQVPVGLAVADQDQFGHCGARSRRAGIRSAPPEPSIIVAPAAGGQPGRPVRGVHDMIRVAAAARARSVPRPKPGARQTSGGK